GSQGNMWSECYENRRKAEYMLEPRASAMAEITWSAKSDIDWDDFKRRLVVQFARMSALDIAYRSPAVIISEDVRGTAVLTQEQKCGEIVYTLDGNDPTPASARYAGPIRVKERAVLKARTLLPGGKLGRVKRAMLMLPKVTIGTSMPQAGFHEPLFGMDGFFETWFWSSRNANAGDHFTLTLREPVALKRVRAITGGEGYHNDRVKKGVLEVAYEGADFCKLATFDERGIAEAETRGVVRAVRLRLTESQQNWLIVRDIDLVE
ncbi:MAG: chitobiase/beta-hexosaminidase C-terminal domain-containing protein, partial [Planctomycetota bacterium]